jgi:TRAP-type C4-dicarboxylate transport system permease small subunit
MLQVLRAISLVNSAILALGRHIAWMALGLMVLVILLQVVFRYVFNNALAWPDEAARFLMLWMTGLIAPSAFRWGGFVAIDMLPLALPRVAGLVLTMILLLLSLSVLAMGLQHGYNHTMGFGGNFDSSSLRLPLDLIGLESLKVKLRYMYGSLLISIILLLLVNVELVLRTAANLISPDASLPPTDAPSDLQRAD